MVAGYLLEEIYDHATNFLEVFYDRGNHGWFGHGAFGADG